MSMRTTLSGCSIAKIQHLIGNADDELVSGIRRGVERFCKAYDDDDDDFDVDDEDDIDDADQEDETGGERQHMAEVLELVLAKLKGQPAAAELKNEGIVGYWVADMLLDKVDGEKRLRTPFEVKHGFWYDLTGYYDEEIGPADAELFRYLEEGRPLFGQTVQTENFYAWFTREEAIRLRDAARRIAAACQERANRTTPPTRVYLDTADILTNEHDGLAPCIDKILAAGYDVWAETG